MFWRGVLGYFPANMVQAAVGFLTIVVFTRLLSAEEYGHYAIGFTVMSLVHTGLFTWNEAAMARFWAGEDVKGDPRDHLATIYRLWSILLVGLPIAVIVLMLWPMAPGLRWATVAGCLTILPRTLHKLAQERRRAAGDVVVAANLDMGLSGGGFLIGAALALAGLGGAAPLLGSGVAAAICVAFVMGEERRRGRGGAFEAERARRYFAYGAPVALSLILALVLSSTDRLLIAVFLDSAQVGVYHAGYSLANRTLDVVFIWLGSASAPALIMALERDGEAAAQTAAHEQAAFMVLLTLPAAVGLAMVARPLADVLVGPELRVAAAQVTPWIAASGFLSGVTTYYFAQAFTLAQRTGLLLAAMSVPALANVALNLLLLPPLGLEGALMATVISYGLGVVVYVILGRRALALPIPWTTVIQASFASLVMALVLSRLPASGGLLELLLKSTVGAAVFGGIAFAINIAHVRSRATVLLNRIHARSA